LENKRGSFGGALAWTLVLSAALGWLPILGPFLAGFVGGRRTRAPGRAFAAALLPAALWWSGLVWASRHELTIRGTGSSLGPLAFLGPVTAAALMGGALAGATGRAARSAGILLLAVGLLAFLPHARDAWELISLVKSAAPYEPAKNKTCPENLKQLYNAAMLYAESWDNTLPPADRWMTAIKDNVPKDEWLHCPEVSHGQGSRFGYAMNPEVGGKKLDAIKEKDKTPLFYDSTDLKPDAHDSPASLPKPGRHTGRDNVVYVSGRVEAVVP
jgi:hypothetical protein